MPQAGPGKEDSVVGGLSLDAAINRLVHFNYDLRTRYQDIYREGTASLNAYLEAQKDYSEMVRRYLEALVRHRRAMLKLNTAVGQRVLP